ncbi:MAG: cupin domain-containing protein [Clostridia bacterium]|nr:cupin domain-containing protein [Clostridia bacterium]
MNSRKNNPFVFEKECCFEDLGNGVKRKILAYGDGLMHVEVHFEEGAEGAMHSHPHAQTTYVLEGEFEFTIGGEKEFVKKGDTMYDAPNVLHGCRCIKKGVLLDTFSPIREDFLK